VTFYRSLFGWNISTARADQSLIATSTWTNCSIGRIGVLRSRIGLHSRTVLWASDSLAPKSELNRRRLDVHCMSRLHQKRPDGSVIGGHGRHMACRVILFTTCLTDRTVLAVTVARSIQYIFTASALSSYFFSLELRCLINPTAAPSGAARHVVCVVFAAGWGNYWSYLVPNENQIAIFCFLPLKADTHYPYIRPERTGV